MNQPNAAQQGIPPLQYPRQTGLIQQPLPHSPRQASNPQQPTSQGPYVSPHSATQSLPPQQYQSPYIGTVPGLPHHHSTETTFFGAHPSPYSTHSAAGSYASSEPGETMATQATMNRQHYPPISSYQTPQSNSPASMHSPQTDAHGRPMYAIPSMPQQMYYQPSYQMQQPPYQQHPSSSHHPSLTSAPPPMMHYQQPQPPPQMQQPQHHPNQQHPGMIDAKSPLASMQRHPSGVAPPQGTPQTPTAPGAATGAQALPTSLTGTNSSAAPGPIPATTPLVVRQDHNGVQWIAFEYSRDRVKMEYTIRCDVESVNTEELSQEFKGANCVYPRACCNKDQYKGNRLHYESECNQVGWALAQLNPPLREKRGLIQRAVDSWRNSNSDVRLRSRRVRRMAKVSTRKGPQMGPGGVQPGPQPSPHAGPHNTQGMTPGPVRPPNLVFDGAQMHHHHQAPPHSAGSENDVNAANDYGNAPVHHHQPPKREDDMATPSSTTHRVAQNFYPTYAQQPDMASSHMPPMPSPMGSMHPHSSITSTSSVKKEDEEETRKRNLFGNVPESKRRKFILVEDGQRGTRVRVRVSLDQVKMDDMPDAHLKINSVYPRSYYPRHTNSPTESSRARPSWDDEDDEAEGVSGTSSTRPKTMVPVPLMDGSEDKMPVPRMTKSRRSKEVALNEIGYRMSWGQARAFNGRTLFLQRSLDAYRNKMHTTMLNAGQDVSTVAPHFETRAGKRRWVDRRKRPGRGESP